MDPQPMGHAALVKRRIAAAVPATTWQGSYGEAEHDGCRFQLFLDHDDTGETVVSIGIAVREGEPRTMLGALCATNGWFAFDCQTGEFIDLTGTATDAQPRRNIVFYRLDGPAELGADGYFKRTPIGDAATTRARLSDTLGSVQWTARGGTFDDGAARVELRLAATGIVDTFDCYAYGAVPEVDRVMRSICTPLGWSAFDCTAGDFIA
jgi:hypothetical protein